MKSPSILSVGEVLWDMFHEGEQFGGAPANFACHAAILGGNVSILSAVGNDRHGYEAIRILKAYGVNTTAMQTDLSAPTGTVSVDIDEAGKPKYMIDENSAWDRIAWTPQVDSCLAGVDAVYFGSLAQRSPKTRETISRVIDEAKQAAIIRVLDINLRSPYFDDVLIRDSIAQASILKLSDDELPRVSAACSIAMSDNHKAVLQHLREIFQLDLVAMTQGAEGAILVSKKATIDQPGIPTQVLDTVGAGDAFTAALVIGLLRGDSLQTTARFACEIASETCTHRGAVPKRQTYS